MPSSTPRKKKKPVPPSDSGKSSGKRPALKEGASKPKKLKSPKKHAWKGAFDGDAKPTAPKSKPKIKAKSPKQAQSQRERSVSIESEKPKRQSQMDMFGFPFGLDDSEEELTTFEKQQMIGSDTTSFSNHRDSFQRKSGFFRSNTQNMNVYPTGTFRKSVIQRPTQPPQQRRSMESHSSGYFRSSIENAMPSAEGNLPVAQNGAQFANIFPQQAAPPPQAPAYNQVFPITQPPVASAVGTGHTMIDRKNMDTTHRQEALLNHSMQDRDEADVVARIKELEESGRAKKVLETISKAFSRPDFNWRRDQDGVTDVKQILAEAEADQQYKKLKRNSRIIIQFKTSEKASLPPLLIPPDVLWRSYWDVFMMVLVCYYAIVTPINIAFEKSPFDILTLEVTFNGFFIADILLQFFTTFKHEKGPNAGRWENSHKRIIWNYLTSWFSVDVIASFPVDLVIRAATGQSSGATFNKLLKLLRGVKLMRILRMSRIWRRLLHKTRINPSLVRLVKLFGFLIVEWHWIGCAYWSLAVEEGFADSDDGWSPHMDSMYLDFWGQYTRAYFWAVMVTTGVGKDIIPDTTVQYMFTTSAIIVGVLMYALIVGGVGSALQSIDTPDGQRRRRMEAVREYLRQRIVSEELTDRIMNYYEYCYTRHITQHDEKILADIHSALQEELDLEMNQQLLSRVPRFQQLPDQLLLVLIHSLLSRIYLPNELVFLIGERASEMFFVARGDLEELDHAGQQISWLTDGAFFGDQLFQMNARRVTTVRCITHCELLILTKFSLKKIMRSFPEFAMMVQKWSGQNNYKTLKPWAKLAYACRATRALRMWGSIATFEEVMLGLTGADKDMAPTNSNEHHGSRIREMSYSDFRLNYAGAFAEKEQKKALKVEDTEKSLGKLLIESAQGLSSIDDTEADDDKMVVESAEQSMVRESESDIEKGSSSNPESVVTVAASESVVTIAASESEQEK